MRALDLRTLAAWRDVPPPAPLVVYGAGDLGKLALHALQRAGVAIKVFCDASPLKQGRFYRDVPIVAPDRLAHFERDARILIANNYIATVLPALRNMGFANIYHCAALFDDTDFDDTDIEVHSLEIRRKIEWHRRECAKHHGRVDELALKYIDIVITEACSMKCVDCSNLMQYYERPKNSDMAQLFTSLDRIMSAADWIDELRVLGGEPFVNKNFAQIIEKLRAFPNLRHIIVYTNGTIVPPPAALAALQDRRVTVNITDYGTLSRRLRDLVSSLEQAGVAHLVKIPSWTDSGRIHYRERSHEQLDAMFANCCVNDVLTLLNGRLYRCPFSANATNLGAVPADPEDNVDIDAMPDREQLRTAIARLYLRGTHLQACKYCNGRDYSTPKIEAAIQVARPLKVPLVSGNTRNP